MSPSFLTRKRHQTRDGSVSAYVSPGGIGPPTPSLPWIGALPPCPAAISQAESLHDSVSNGVSFGGHEYGPGAPRSAWGPAASRAGDTGSPPNPSVPAREARSADGRHAPAGRLARDAWECLPGVTQPPSATCGRPPMGQAPSTSPPGQSPEASERPRTVSTMAAPLSLSLLWPLHSPRGHAGMRSNRKPASEAGGRVGVCPGLLRRPPPSESHRRRPLLVPPRSPAPYPVVRVMKTSLPVFACRGMT
jgi:hypothetical protein